jgi:hypothetical protein
VLGAAVFSCAGCRPGFLIRSARPQGRRTPRDHWNTPPTLAAWSRRKKFTACSCCLTPAAASCHGHVRNYHQRHAFICAEQPGDAHVLWVGMRLTAMKTALKMPRLQSGPGERKHRLHEQQMQTRAGCHWNAKVATCDPATTSGTSGCSEDAGKGIAYHKTRSTGIRTRPWHAEQGDHELALAPRWKKRELPQHHVLR